MTDSGRPPCTVEAVQAQIDALSRLLDEREERTKERFESMKVAVDAALASADRAVSKAEQATEKRFESVNEFRKTLADQTSNFLTRAEFNVQHKAVVDTGENRDKLVAALQVNVSKLEQRALGKIEGLSLVSQIILGFIAAVASIAAVITALGHVK